MIPAKEIDGELWVKASDHHQAIKEALAQKQEQEPQIAINAQVVGYVDPQRTWVGLTPEEILDMFDDQQVYGSKWLEFARAVETKLKEKNT